MRIAFAFLAHSALAHPDGTISAIGVGIDTMHATEFPAAVPLIAAVAKIESPHPSVAATMWLRLFRSILIATHSRIR